MSSEPRHWMVFGQLVMPVQCCAEARQWHGSEDIMSLGIKSSATGDDGPWCRRFLVLRPRFFFLSLWFLVLRVPMWYTEVRLMKILPWGHPPNTYDLAFVCHFFPKQCLH